ncbi:hypothetical protein BHE74_00029492 [Ensete ventricosum]|nr:hypothetical protein BHE74_00029492 [Ensete ventricosum]
MCMKLLILFMMSSGNGMSLLNFTKASKQAKHHLLLFFGLHGLENWVGTS